MSRYDKSFNVIYRFQSQISSGKSNFKVASVTKTQCPQYNKRSSFIYHGNTICRVHFVGQWQNFFTNTHTHIHTRMHTVWKITTQLNQYILRHDIVTNLHYEHVRSLDLWPCCLVEITWNPKLLEMCDTEVKHLDSYMETKKWYRLMWQIVQQIIGFKSQR